TMSAGAAAQSASAAPCQSGLCMTPPSAEQKAAQQAVQDAQAAIDHLARCPPSGLFALNGCPGSLAEWTAAHDNAVAAALAAAEQLAAADAQAQTPPDQQSDAQTPPVDLNCTVKSAWCPNVDSTAGGVDCAKTPQDAACDPGGHWCYDHPEDPNCAGVTGTYCDEHPDAAECNIDQAPGLAADPGAVDPGAMGAGTP